MTTKDDKKPEADTQTAEEAATAAKEQHEQAVLVEAKRLHGMGFGTEQITHHLSSKFTMTVDDAAAFLGRNDYKAKSE